EHGLGLEPYRLQIGHRLLKLRRNFRAFLDQPFVLSNILATSHGSLVVLRLEIFHVNVFHGNRFGGYYFTSSDSGRLSRYEFGGWRGGCLHHGFAMASTGSRSGVTEKLPTGRHRSAKGGANQSARGHVAKYGLGSHGVIVKSGLRHTPAGPVQCTLGRTARHDG